MAPAHHALGVLHRDTTLALFHKDHAHDQHNDGNKHEAKHEPAGAVEDIDPVSGNAGGNAGKDEQRHAVAHAPLGDDFAQPHHQHRAGRHNEHENDEVEKGAAFFEYPGALAEELFPVGEGHNAGRLQQGQRQCEVPGVLVHFGLAGLPLFFQLFKPRNHHGKKLHNNGGSDVGHHANGKNGQLQQGAAREQVD